MEKGCGFIYSYFSFRTLMLKGAFSKSNQRGNNCHDHEKQVTQKTVIAIKASKCVDQINHLKSSRAAVAISASQHEFLRKSRNTIFSFIIVF